MPFAASVPGAVGFVALRIRNLSLLLHLPLNAANDRAQVPTRTGGPVDNGVQGAMLLQCCPLLHMHFMVPVSLEL